MCIRSFVRRRKNPAWSFRFFGERIYRRNDYLQRIVVKIQIAYRGERKPLRVIEATGGAELKLGKWGFRKKIRNSLSLLPSLHLRVVGDVLVDTKFFHNGDVEYVAND